MTEPNTLQPGAEWNTISRRARFAVPEAFFSADGSPLNLVAGEWRLPGKPKPFRSPVDGTSLASFPMLDSGEAKQAVAAAARAFRAWSRTDLDERRRRVSACARRIREHRELLASLLGWEIGKPYEQSLTSVDRCVSGVEWYVDHIEEMIEGRSPLGVVSNIASWNYPMSVLMHAALVQALSGNTVIAKTPSDGGLLTLTVATALAAREGIPISLVSGSGAQLSEVLVGSDEIACVSFVGGKSSGSDVAERVNGNGKRYMLEMEGVNAWGIWHFSHWSLLRQELLKGFEYARQRCTAYPRYVVERRLFPRFLDTYLGALKSVTFGHPFGRRPSGSPGITFGPLINGRSAEDLRAKCAEAVELGAVVVAERSLSDGSFLPGQDTSAYFAPLALMNVPRNCRLYHLEPFGPVDTFVIVDSEAELVTEMNISNGSLVASLACDEPKEALRIASELRAFKIGINQARSRGDREEPFGGLGASWKGCFVGGEHLVRAVTRGAAGEPLCGNFPHATLLPAYADRIRVAGPREDAPPSRPTRESAATPVSP